MKMIELEISSTAYVLKQADGKYHVMMRHDIPETIRVKSLYAFDDSKKAHMMVALLNGDDEKLREY